ncbi:MAG: ACP dehydratase, partial [Desulfobulbaceae bacterium]|nr:ACP dehydratase [Desulfobulbaceae bacterium]
RPPMLLVDRLLERDCAKDLCIAEARAPIDGIFVNETGMLIPEYYLELIAQSMAAGNGYDAQCDRVSERTGYLVGIDAFTWFQDALPGEILRVDLKKIFEFGSVTIMAGEVINQKGRVIAEGEIKVWEETS